MGEKAKNGKKKNGSFGYQLILDLYDCRENVCDDLDYCYDFLEEITNFLGMQKQAPPDIFRSDAKKYPDKAGLSGWVPLIESSVVIHTLSKKRFISVDVYSCKKYNPENVKQFVARYFEPKRIDNHFIQRGIDYNK